MAWTLPTNSQPWFQGAGQTRRFQPVPSTPRPTPVNGPGMGVNPGTALGNGPFTPAAVLGNSSPAQPNDDQMSGYGSGGGSPLGQRSEGDVAHWLTQRDVASQNGGLGIDGWGLAKMAAGAAAPMGSGLLGMGQAIGNAWNGTPMSQHQLGKLGASLIGGPLGGATKLGEFMAGTKYAQNNPVATFSREGENDATMAADRMFRAGGTPQQMQAAFDAIRAQQNLGGAGNPQAAARAAWDSMMRDGKIHIATEPGWENPNATPTVFNDGSSAEPLTNDQLFGIGQQSTGNFPSEFAVQPGAPGSLDLSMPAPTDGPVVDTGFSSDAGGASWDSDPGDNSAIAEAMGSDWFATGGIVNAPRFGSFNPPGPDDQMAALQSGEGVLRRSAMQKIGPDMFHALNKGKISREALMRAAKGMKGYASGGIVDAPAEISPEIAALENGEPEDLMIYLSRYYKPDLEPVSRYKEMIDLIAPAPRRKSQLEPEYYGYAQGGIVGDDLAFIEDMEGNRVFQPGDRPLPSPPTPRPKPKAKQQARRLPSPPPLRPSPKGADEREITRQLNLRQLGQIAARVASR